MDNGTIIYIGGFELPDKNAAAHRVLSNGKAFRELDYRVVFIDVDKSLSDGTDILATFKNVQGFDCWSVPYPNTKLEWARHLSNVDFLKIIMGRYKNVRLIVAYNYPALALWKIKRFCEKKQVKVIGDCTEWYGVKGAGVIYKVIKGLDVFFRMKIIQKKLDGIIVISRYLENYYESCNVIKIPPLVDVGEEKWNIYNKKIKRTKNTGNKLSLVYSGTPGLTKDKITNIVDALFELIAFDNYKLDIIGLSKGEFINENPNYLDKIDKLKSRIHFLGRISHRDSLEKLKIADYSIFVRDKSRLTMAGFPTKFTESITCSTPVITNETSDLKDFFLDETYGLLLRDSNVDTLKDVLAKKILDDSVREKKAPITDNKIFHYVLYIDKFEKFLANVMQ